jgi:Domain of unknown function (DUF3854)
MLDRVHAIELAKSAISDDIAQLNFRSFDPDDETDLDRVFLSLIAEPDHRNNGTLAGKSANDLANALRYGGWIFRGFKGVCIKLDRPRRNADGKIIKYESPRGTGNQQLFIPLVSTRLAIDMKMPPDRTEFWDWFVTTNYPLIITEGAKKAAALISSGYPAIGLNGIWGWGANVLDMFGNTEVDSIGKSLKTLHPDLDPFLSNREIILAFDRDTNHRTVAMVEVAKSRLVQCAIKIEVCSQLKWFEEKGIDDYIYKHGIAALKRLYLCRREFDPFCKQFRASLPLVCSNRKLNHLLAILGLSTDSILLLASLAGLNLNPVDRRIDRAEELKLYFILKEYYFESKVIQSWLQERDPKSLRSAKSSFDELMLIKVDSGEFEGENLTQVETYFDRYVDRSISAKMLRIAGRS